MIEMQYFLLLTVTADVLPQDGLENRLDQARNRMADLALSSNERDSAFHRYINNVS